MFSYLWGGQKAEDAKEENADPELATREALDAHGEFATKVDGTLEFDAFMIFRAIITRQAGRAFAPKRAELNKQKLEAYKEKN